MFDWLRRKKKKEPIEGVPVEGIPVEEPAEEEPEWVRDERIRAEQEARDRWTREKAKREAEEKVAGERAREELEAERRKRWSRRELEEEKIEEELSRLSPKEQEKYKKRIREARGVKSEVAFEVWESGIPEKKQVIQKTWNPVTQQHEFEIIEVPMSPQERLAEARIQKLGGALVEEELSGLKQRRRERSLPFRAAKAAGGFGQLMVGTAMLGVAGTAQAIQPGREGPRRAARMHAPGLPMEAYQVGTPSWNLSGLRSPNVNLLGLTRPIQPRLHIGGLEHIRGLTLPRRRR